MGDVVGRLREGDEVVRVSLGDEPVVEEEVVRGLGAVVVDEGNARGDVSEGTEGNRAIRLPLRGKRWEIVIE